MDTKHPLPIDNAFLGKSLKGGSHEPTFSGALSFMRRRYSRDLNGVTGMVAAKLAKELMCRLAS